MDKKEQALQSEKKKKGFKNSPSYAPLETTPMRHKQMGRAVTVLKGVLGRLINLSENHVRELRQPPQAASGLRAWSHHRSAVGFYRKKLRPLTQGSTKQRLTRPRLQSQGSQCLPILI